MDHFKAWPIIVGTQDETETFNHPQAINRAAAQTDASVIVMVDADTICPPHVLEDMVRRVHRGVAPWALTTHYTQLTLRQTEHLMALGRWKGEPEWVGVENFYTGVVAIDHAAFDRIGGYDERFRGWGADDGAFTHAMVTMNGPPTRVFGHCTHLWHPRDEEMHEHQGFQHELLRRYEAASGDPIAMKQVLFG